METAPSSPGPPSPRPPVCRGVEGCSPEPPPAPSHTPWKTLRVSHSPAASAATGVHRSNCRRCTKVLDAGENLPGWASNTLPDGSRRLHGALFVAAGLAPVRLDGEKISLDREPFLRLVFQEAKPEVS